MSDTIRVLLADDHDLVRAGLKAALRAHPDFNVVAEARDGEEAVREARKEKPDLVVLDVRMPRLSGIEACREIRSAVPESNVLMLTSFADEKAVMAAILAGASGFMLKDVHTADLIDAMRQVGKGGKILDPASSAAVIEQIRRDRRAALPQRAHGQAPCERYPRQARPHPPRRGRSLRHPPRRQAPPRLKPAPPP